MVKSLKTAAAAVAALVVLVLGARLAGYRVVIEPVDGEATRTVTSFDAVAPSVLDQDFGSEPETRNVVILIGDGMGFGQLLGGRAAVAGLNGRLFMERLPVTGWLSTHSAHDVGTDSAAGATALAAGHKTSIGRLGVTADGRPVRSLMEAAAARGMATGLITDSYLWDATPAAFAVHVETRRDRRRIADQMAASGFDLLLGEEYSGLLDGPDGSRVIETFRREGYSLVRDAHGLSAADEGRILGLFGSGSVADPGRPPELEDLVDFALARLSRENGGFVLMVETEEPDTASHDGDFERMVRGVAALDRAVERAVDFARRDRHTLVLVTADHETGGLALMGGGEGEPLRVRWSTGGHTGNPVPLLAFGPGAERLGGVRDNTEVPRILAGILGLSLEGAAPAARQGWSSPCLTFDRLNP